MSATQTAHAEPAAKSPEQEMLYDLRERVVAWRMRTNKSVYWMPKPLWEEVIAAGQLCGSERVAKFLRIEPEDLSNRLRLVHSPAATAPLAAKPTPPAAAPAPATPATSAEEFFEMPGIDQGMPPPDPDALHSIAPRERPAQTLPAAAPDAPADIRLSASEEAVVEVLAANGDKLILRVPMAQFDIHTVIHQFRSRP